jgi:hypothetical protein
MTAPDITKHYATVNVAANVFLNCLGPSFTDTPNGHIETDIAGASSIAGLMLLRATGIDLMKYEPGTVILTDVHEAQAELLRFIRNVAYSMGLEFKTGWDMPVPKEHKPLFSTLQLMHKLERPFYEACSQTGVPKDCYPYVAALAAMKLVAAGEQMNLLDANIGKGLALYYIVAGSKTVPYPSASV